jgi:hypothetical protein
MGSSIVNSAAWLALIALRARCYVSATFNMASPILTSGRRGLHGSSVRSIRTVRKAAPCCRCISSKLRVSFVRIAAK